MHCQLPGQHASTKSKQASKTNEDGTCWNSIDKYNNGTCSDHLICHCLHQKLHFINVEQYFFLKVRKMSTENTDLVTLNVADCLRQNDEICWAWKQLSGLADDMNTVWISTQMYNQKPDQAGISFYTAPIQKVNSSAIMFLLVQQMNCHPQHVALYTFMWNKLCNLGLWFHYNYTE